jgi:hypothetical protein
MAARDRLRLDGDVLVLGGGVMICEARTRLCGISKSAGCAEVLF